MVESSLIKRNSFFSFLTIYIRLFVNIVLFLFIARSYGPSVFGQFTYAHTLATTFIFFADFGFDLLLTIEVAKNRKNSLEVFNNIFPFKLIFSIIAVGGMWIVSYFASVTSETQDLILLFSLYVISTSLTNFLSALFKGYEKLHYETFVALVINGLLLISTLFLVYYKVSIFIIALTFIITRTIGLIVGIVITRNLISQVKLRFNFSGWKKYKSKFLVFGLHLLFGNLYFQLDTILLGLWKSETEVGIYQAVFKLIMLALIIPEVFINALLPILSRFHKENINNWKKLGSLLNKLLTLIVLPISLIIFIYSEQIIKLVYSDQDYNEAIPILKVFALIVLVRFSVETYALMLTTSDKQKYRMIVVVSATFLNFILNSYAIPTYGLLGAAYTSLTTNIFVGLGYLFLTYPLLLDWLFSKENLMSLVFIAGIGFVSISMPQTSFLIMIPLIIIIYFTFIWFFVLKSNEKRMLFSGELGFKAINIIVGSNNKK